VTLSSQKYEVGWWRVYAMWPSLRAHITCRPTRDVLSKTTILKDDEPEPRKRLGGATLFRIQVQDAEHVFVTVTVLALANLTRNACHPCHPS
jgi:hypothetical protein